jgi:ATP-dependent DNA helicase RecQ
VDDEDPVSTLARERFGVGFLFPYQRLAMANVLDSVQSDGPIRQLVLLPTGFGKSLCFQLPALLLPGPTVVAYPLLALMADQKRRLESLGMACALFRGGQEPSERRAAELAVERGEAKIVISNPECLASPRLLDFLKEARPSHLAIDEAHCVSEWGGTFRPSYLEMGRVAETLAPPALSAFTATASPTVFEAVAGILFRDAAYRVISGDPDRPNISYAVVRTLSRERSLVRLAASMERPLIVFCSSREGTQVLARLLRDRGGGAGEEELRFYHAGLERDEKKAVEEWFFGSRRGILVATCAYGLGIDKKDIRSVIHFEAPSSVEAYLQESGRAGRDGAPSRAVLLAGPRDRERLGRESDPLRRRRFEALLSYASSEGGCRRDGLLDLLGVEREGRPPCSGCDRCAGEASRAWEGELEIAAFAKANARRFSPDEAIALLRGDSTGPGGAEPPRCLGWASLAGWDARDAARAMDEALRLGLVRRAAWPWKGALTRARPSLILVAGRRPLAPRLGRRGGGGRSLAGAGGRAPSGIDRTDVAQGSECDDGGQGDGYDPPILKHAEGNRQGFS